MAVALQCLCTSVEAPSTPGMPKACAIALTWRLIILVVCAIFYPFVYLNSFYDYCHRYLLLSPETTCLDAHVVNKCLSGLLRYVLLWKRI